MLVTVKRFFTSVTMALTLTGAISLGQEYAPETDVEQVGFFGRLGSMFESEGDYSCVPEMETPDAAECESDCESGWCDLGDPFTVQGLLQDECDEPWFNYGGWLQGGYTNKSDGVFNTVPDRFNLHQAWLYAERIANGEDGLDFGFRADVMYGIDGNNTQAFGNPTGSWDFVNGFDHGVYGWALPQLYGEVAYDKLSVKAGHFYTPLGYESVMAPLNFFYSHAYTMNFSEPFTHTGAIATYQATDDVKVLAGWTLGWDTGFDQLNQGNSWVGGTIISLNENMTFTYLSTAGNLGWIGEGYSHAILLDTKITDKLQYVFQTDFINTDVGVFGGNTYHTVGINNYIFYTINDCVKAGARLEWWKVDGVSLYETTYGVNVKPHANVTIRPEIRYQWSPSNAVAAPFQDETIVGIDAIITF